MSLPLLLAAAAAAVLFNKNSTIPLPLIFTPRKSVSKVLKRRKSRSPPRARRGRDHPLPLWETFPVGTAGSEGPLPGLFSPAERVPSPSRPRALVGYSLDVDGGRGGARDGGDEAVVPAQVQAGGLRRLPRHRLVALVDVQGLVGLAVADDGLVVAVVG